MANSRFQAFSAHYIVWRRSFCPLLGKRPLIEHQKVAFIPSFGLHYLGVGRLRLWDQVVSGACHLVLIFTYLGTRLIPSENLPIRIESATEDSIMRIKTASCALALLMAAGLGRVVPGADSGTSSIRGITKPSGDVTLSFIRPGRVKEISFKEGEAVKAGSVVAVQDDIEEQAQLRIDQADANDNTEIDVNIFLLKEDQQTLDRTIKAMGSTSEIEDARSKVQVDEARIELAKQKQKTAKIKVEATEALISKLKINSPIDGVVAESALKVGEVADGQNMKVMRVVQVDPLWVESAVPIAIARQLKPQDVANVTFSDGQVRPGAVALVFPVGDSASETIKVRLEIPNPQKLQPGENVRVSFGGDGHVAAAQKN